MTDVPGDFGFGEDHEILREGARRFLAERCPMEAVRRRASEPTAHDAALWKEMAELGWTGLTIPEAHGGAGLGNLHQVLLLEEMGRRLLPAPYLGTVLASLVVAVAGDESQQARWLPGIASGERVGTVAWLEPGGCFEPASLTATAGADGDGFVLSGTKSQVLAGGAADVLLAPFLLSDGPQGKLAVFVVEAGAPGLAVEPEVCVDPTRPTARLRFENVRVPAEARLATGSTERWARLLVQGAAWLAGEMVGAAEGILDLTRAYAIERKQFGRQIGSFQAVKHPLVDDMIAIEMARTQVYAAAAAYDEDPAGATTAARMAKAAISEAFATAVRHGIQFHGGYGFTIDCDAHYYFKRSLVCRGMLGDGVHHRRHLADELLGDAPG